jgi:hypothetical protein
VARNPAAHTALDNTLGVAELLKALREAGADEQVSALANRAAHIALDNTLGVAELLKAMWQANAEEQAIRLADRAADRAAFNDPRAVAELLKALREMGAEEQVSALVARDPAAHTALNNQLSVAELVKTLREAGAQEQAIKLADRAVASTADVISSFDEQESHSDRFWLGNGPDERQAKPWGWEDLSLSPTGCRRGPGAMRMEKPGADPQDSAVTARGDGLQVNGLHVGSPLAGVAGGPGCLTGRVV